MAKKTSRQVSKGDSSATTARVSRTGRTSEAAASPDFSYVRSDLKRIGILVGSMFAVMIALYFILPFVLPLYAR